MSDRPIKIFISYARDDDKRPPGPPEVMGFVEHLHVFMNYSFTNAGPERPQFWRDEDNLYRGEQSWPVIERALNESSFLLVVLSKNWIDSDYCKRELAHFVRRFQQRSESVDERIIIAAKNHVLREGRPPGLEHQDGFKFYALSDRTKLSEVEFFVRGKPLDDGRYWAAFDELCDFILRRARQVNSRDARAAEPDTPRRTVYVAKPASDMLGPYIRVVKELSARGYKVVPKRNEDIPSNGPSPESLENLLAAAEVSVHLLGESGGGTEELNSDAKLQLAAAADRIAKSGAAQNGSDPTFRRILWVPKAFRVDGESDSKAVERDPFDVVKRFGTQLASDKVIGEDVGTFVQSLMQLLETSAGLDAPAPSEIDGPATPVAAPGEIDGQTVPVTAPGETNGHAAPVAARGETDGSAPPAAAAFPNSKIFILHTEKDRPLARSIRRALRERSIEAVFPVTQGDEVQRKAYDKESIRICDSIAVCWGASSEVWTLAQARQFSDWRIFGRSQRWVRLSVILGPPPGEIKKEFIEDGPPSEIDVVVDLEDGDAISAETLNKLVPNGKATAA
jgi:hypothetical protein